LTKREFVQRAAIRIFDPAAPDVDQAVDYAERLWQRLSERGYGAPREQGPRQNEDWYSRLTPEQQALFDRFWRAFNLKRGKQGAAMRWAQICPDAETAEHIIAAAEAEARRKLPEGQQRKMAQGWLFERRWEDFEPPAAAAPGGADTARERSAEIRRLRVEANHLDLLLRHEKHEHTAQQLRDQADELRARIAVLEQETDG